MTHTVNVTVFPDKQEACRQIAAEVATLIREINAKGRPAVLGLATGGTPVPFYNELIQLHQQGLSFKEVITFNLDEYLGVGKDHPQSYWQFMHEKLFNHVDIDPSNIHIPAGMVEDADAHCASYEEAIRAAGGIDFQVLGIGRTGHIGFNEPGSPKDSRTRQVELDAMTREDAAKDFGGLDKVPESAITMGCGTILEAKKIALLAFGEHKAGIVAEALNGPITDRISASFLQEHPDATYYLDEAAAAKL